MISADYAVLVTLISFGALVGKANSLQLLVVAIVETIFFSINEAICFQLLQITDHGRAIVVHLFGAVFGLAVSRMIYSSKICTSQALSTSNKSEMYSMLGELLKSTLNQRYLNINMEVIIALYVIKSNSPGK